MENYESIWETVFRDRVPKEVVSPKKKVNTYERTCEHTERNETTCINCGLVLENQPEFDNFMYEQPIETKVRSAPFNRLTKLQDWISWTKEEKTEYKLKKYVREFCEQLSIYPNIIDNICHLVNHVLQTIKEKNDGSKRSKVKDAIIINCICHVSPEYDPNYLAKRANIEAKYLSKADRILLDLHLTEQKQPNDNLQQQLRKEFMLKNGLCTNVEDKLKILMEIVEDNQLINDDSSLSVICFYYLLMHETVVDLREFTEHFKINPTNLTKSFNKLKKIQEKINKMLNDTSNDTSN